MDPSMTATLWPMNLDPAMDPNASSTSPTTGGNFPATSGASMNGAGLSPLSQQAAANLYARQ
jgi:hypothetical protein